MPRQLTDGGRDSSSRHPAFLFQENMDINEEVKLPIGGGVEVSVDAAPEKKKGGRKLIGIAPLTNAERQARHKAKTKEKKQAAAYVYDSQTEPTKVESRSILEMRGLRNDHVIKTTNALLLRAAEDLGLPANRFLFANGITQTLRSYGAKAAQPLAEIAAEDVTGELINRAELFALYDASVAWREPET